MRGKTAKSLRKAAGGNRKLYRKLKKFYVLYRDSKTDSLLRRAYQR